MKGIRLLYELLPEIKKHIIKLNIDEDMYLDITDITIEEYDGEKIYSCFGENDEFLIEFSVMEDKTELIDVNEIYLD